MPIATKVMSSNPSHGELYLIQIYVKTFVSDLWQICGFSGGTPASSTNKTERHNIAEILLKATFKAQ